MGDKDKPLSVELWTARSLIGDILCQKGADGSPLVVQTCTPPEQPRRCRRRRLPAPQVLIQSFIARLFLPPPAQGDLDGAERAHHEALAGLRRLSQSNASAPVVSALRGLAEVHRRKGPQAHSSLHAAPPCTAAPPEVALRAG